MSDNLYLFANNNGTQAENFGSYRLYDMKIEGDTEGVNGGVNYVDYLIGDGASWINTKLVLATGYRVSVKFRCLKSTYDYYKDGENQNRYNCIYGSANPVAFGYDNSHGTTVALYNNGICIRDNGSAGWATAYAYQSIVKDKDDIVDRKLVNVTNPNSVYLFGNNAGVSKAVDICKDEVMISEFKVWNTQDLLLIHLRPCLDTQGVPCMYDEVSKKYFYNKGTGTFSCKKILRDFQPVLDNNIPCLLDKINNKFYYNKGTGSFTYGGIQTPKDGYTEVEYIESNGTQYIDTGVVPNSNTDIDMTCRACDYSDYISDGLILNLDGINNTRRGHKSDTTVWEDLSGNGLDFDLHNVTINDNSMYFTGDRTGSDTYSYASIKNLDHWVNLYDESKKYTVELCMKFDNTIDNYAPIISAKPSAGDIARSIQNLVFKNTSTGYELDRHTFGVEFISFTVSCNMSDLTIYDNTITQTTNTKHSSIDPPNNNAFWIGIRLSGSYYAYKGYIYSIRIYDRPLTDAERLYNHSVDVKRFGVETAVATCNTGKFMMNNLTIDNSKYNYKDTDTTVKPNLVASEGATLTMGSQNIAYLTEAEIAQAVLNGWTIQ